MTRPVSLALRLFGNIFAGGVLVHTMLGIAPFITFVFLGLELFVGVIQALIILSVSVSTIPAFSFVRLTGPKISLGSVKRPRRYSK